MQAAYKMLMTVSFYISLILSTLLAAEEGHTENPHWKLGVQAYTFRSVSFFETVDKVHELGLKYIEMYPGQKLKPGSLAKTGSNLSEADLAEMQEKLKSNGVKLVSYGVSPIPADEPSARALFEWAMKLGIEVLVTETKPNEMMDQLTSEYGIKIAIHNHPKTWPPDQVLAATKDFSPRMGACADVGHWYRSGFDTVASLKLLGNRVIHAHFKDVARATEAKPGDNLFKQIPDVPWGTGQCNIPGMMSALKNQTFDGYLIIEYETGSMEELMQNIPKSLRFFNQTNAQFSP